MRAVEGRAARTPDPIPNKMQDFDAECRPLSSYRARDVKWVGRETRLDFIRKVYGILSCQLLVTTVVSAWIYSNGQNTEWLRSHEWLLWLSVAMTMSTICVMACCDQTCKIYPTNYIFLYLFTVFEAIMVGFVSAIFTWQSVLLAAGISVFVFLGLTLYACNTEVARMCVPRGSAVVS